jgi:ubiquinone/menaquinone biosynthesis C-methylase UbiE
MPVQAIHGMLPDTTHDEMSRQNFVMSMRAFVTAGVTPGHTALYEKVVKPRFVRENNRPPKSRHEIRRAMLKEPYHQTWSALLRTTQELIWDCVGESIERQLPELNDYAKELTKGKTKGTLTVDPDLEIPRYVSAVDIHCMPGNYDVELTEGDVYSGALYDRGVFVYMIGGLGDSNQGCGDAMIGHLGANFPKFTPTKILDIGCSVGHSTVPYAVAFPDAEVHGIDVGAPMVRYAHARAEDIGVAVHYSQQNAEFTNFEDNSFDLIVSHIMLHETSHKAIRNIMREGHRLIRPGGIVLHLEVPPYKTTDVLTAYLRDWDTHFNAEPFIGGLHDMEPRDLMKEAGFRDDEIIVDYVTRSIAEGDRNDIYRGYASHHTGDTVAFFGAQRAANGKS